MDRWPVLIFLSFPTPLVSVVHSNLLKSTSLCVPKNPRPALGADPKMLGLEDYSVAVLVPTAFVIYIVGTLLYTAVYNLFFHPLAHIPGPRLAAATYLYQTYFSLAGGHSRYYVKIKALHEIYGMSASDRLSH